MIAGPSSSGKTTFSHRLATQFRALGYTPHPIAVDNYFKNREDYPRDENGKLDMEALECVDIEKFNEDMNGLLNGRLVEIPRFNFVTGTREYNGDFLKLGKNDVLIIEGIHCLNDKLSYSLPAESRFKIYISALTQLNVDEHNRIPTADGGSSAAWCGMPGPGGPRLWRPSAAGRRCAGARIRISSPSRSRLT